MRGGNRMTRARKRTAEKTGDAPAEKTFSPYLPEGCGDAEEEYRRYLKDPAGIITLGGRRYYRILERFPISIRNRPVMFVFVDNNINWRVGGVLTDEFGHRFTVDGFEVCRSINGSPNWLFHASTLPLSGDVDAMGEYLTNTEERFCKCAHLPGDGHFLPDGIYRWTDRESGFRVFDEDGTEWAFDGAGFGAHFTIIDGKPAV